MRTTWELAARVFGIIIAGWNGRHLARAEKREHEETWKWQGYFVAAEDGAAAKKMGLKRSGPGLLPGPACSHYAAASDQLND